MDRQPSWWTGAPVRVLDVGCGLKPYYPFFASVASEYVGVDVVENPAAELLGPVEALPVEDASFDLVLCTQVLEHCDDPAQAVRELHRVTRPGGRVLASTHGVQVYHPSPSDYWRWTHEGLRRLFARQRRMVEALGRAGGAGPRRRSRCCSGRTSRSPCAGRSSRAPPVWLLNRAAAAAERRAPLAPRPDPGIADPELSRRRARLMRLLRRNALGVYGVYAAAIVSGLVVTPVVIHSIGKTSFGVWTFIGAITIYLSLLDFGVGPSIVRFGAEARGRRATADLDEIASTGLAIYAAIGVVTLPVGLVLAWIVPWASHAPEDLVWDARVATFLVVLVARGAVPARAVQQPARRTAALGSAEPRELRRRR